MGFKDLLDHMNPYTTVGDIINVVGDRRRFAVGEVSQVMQAISRETEKRLQEGKH